jgi:beta-lactamase class A
MWKAVGLLTLVAGVLTFSVGYLLADAGAIAPVSVPVSTISPAVDTPAPPTPAPVVETTNPTPTAQLRSFDTLAAQVNAIVSESGAQVGMSLIELGGTSPSTWQEGGTVKLEAASTYKLVVLMQEAQAVSAGTRNPSGTICFEDSDWEDGWFDDYATGTCYTRNELAQRAGQYSDNTAGHMLVRDIGGAPALNTFAAEMGAQDSSFYDPNQTTADDLARLIAAEATGRAGGAPAQAWLYPVLVHSHFESGLPAGVPAGITVVHKTGEIDSSVDDAGLVSGGPHGDYVLAVMTNGLTGDAAWQLIAQLSAAVWSYEAGR